MLTITNLQVFYDRAVEALRRQQRVTLCVRAPAVQAGPECAMAGTWAQGQLESEIVENAWLTVPADLDLIFDTPVAERYTRAMGLLGLQQPWMLSPDAGHA